MHYSINGFTTACGIYATPKKSTSNLNDVTCRACRESAQSDEYDLRAKVLLAGKQEPAKRAGPTGKTS